MTCCTPAVYPFNGSTLTIDYGAEMQALYGPDPNVQVYFREGTDYVLSDDGNQIRFTGTSIEVDFGGPAVGIVKVF